MNEEFVQLAGQTVQVVTVQTAVVGSGAAGLNAASRLFSFGRRGSFPSPSLWTPFTPMWPSRPSRPGRTS